MNGLLRIGLISAVVVCLGCETSAPPPPPLAPAPENPPPQTSTEIIREPQATEVAAAPPATEPAKPATDVEEEPAEAAPPKHPPLFEKWPKPEVLLVFSGQQQGYIEPCGCTGLANQKGGLARRDTFFEQVKARGWDIAAFDVGNQVKRFGAQADIKFQRSTEGLRTMGYEAVVLGTSDLKLSELVSATIPEEGKPNLFVSANIALLDRGLTPTYRVLEAGGKKIGVTGVLGAGYESKLEGDDIVHVPPEEGLKEAAAALAEAKCDVQILLAHATEEEATDLAKKFPQFDLIVTSAGVGEPPFDIEAIPGAKGKRVQVGTKGMFVTAVGVFSDAKKFRTQRVPLDDRFADSPRMMKLLGDYQEQLKSIGLEGLGLKPQPHPSGREFVGSQKCGECHTKAFAVWEKSKHAHATESLVHPKERGIPRHFDPECLSCHVTGWEPQKFYPFVSGYEGLDATPLMLHNGCENCHGPGNAHVAAEEGAVQVSKAEQQKLRDALKLPLANKVAERRCMECHDIDNSPDFHTPGAFEKYWKDVEHVGKD